MTVVTLEMALRSLEMTGGASKKSLRSLEMTGVTLEIGSASFNEP